MCAMATSVYIFYFVDLCTCIVQEGLDRYDGTDPV